MTDTMLSCRNSKRQRNLEVCFDHRADENLAYVRTKYEELLGRPVSASVVVRRGLDLLASYLRNRHGEDWIKDEFATLVHHIR